MSALYDILGEISHSATSDMLRREQLLAEARTRLQQLSEPQSAAEWAQRYNAQLFIATHSGDPTLSAQLPTLLEECLKEAMAQSFDEGYGCGANNAARYD